LAIARRGKLYLTTLEPMRYEDREDTTLHEAMSGDTLMQIAELYYGKDGWKYWRMLAMFQPDPIVDPTVAFKAGKMVYVPSRRKVSEYMNPSVRR